MNKNTLTITDNRTGKTYEVPIHYGTYPAQSGTIQAMDLRHVKTSGDDFGLVCYDPGFRNTASCRSAITFVDGERQVMRHRGYPIEQLAEQSTYLEVAYLLINGELPTQAEYDAWWRRIAESSMIHESIKSFLEGFKYDTHTMGMLVGALGALSTFYPDSRELICQSQPGEPPSCDLERLDGHIYQLMGSVPTIAAFGYRHSRGLPYVYPDFDLEYICNFLNMLFGSQEVEFHCNPVLERALDVLFILHADHDQSCSTTTMRTIGSSHADPYSSLAGAAAALYGPLHGGANAMVLQILKEIGSKDRVPEYLGRVKAGEALLPGFGHRLYRNGDPRVPIIKTTISEVFEVTGPNPLMEIALEVERVAGEDEYFVSRHLYPNTEFYSGIVYQSMGLPLDMISVMFAIPRTAGWLANWKEMLLDQEQRIYRPRQVYAGVDARTYVPMDRRK